MNWHKHYDLQRRRSPFFDLRQHFINASILCDALCLLQHSNGRVKILLNRKRLQCDGSFCQWLSVALICHGPTYSSVHRQYVAHLESRFQSKIVDFSVRKKVDAWTPAHLYARFENGAVFQEKFDDTEYGYAFRVYSRPACYDCRFRRGERPWDLMIGDFWGASEADPFWNSYGVSAILAHTQSGLDFLRQTPEVKLFDTTVDRIIAQNPCICKARAPLAERERFASLYETHGLIAAAQECREIRK